MSAYLLDTSCFYSVSKNSLKQQKLRSMGSELATSLVAVMEIARITRKPGDFNRRKRAMKALDFISPLIHQRTPDDIVAKAFGQPEPQTEPIDYRAIMRAIILADSYEEAIRGVTDHQQGVTVKIKPELLTEWKQSTSSYFVDTVVSGNERTREIFLNQLQERNPGLNERQLKSLSQELTRMTSRREEAYLYTLVGLSFRAGLHTESELIQAISSREINNLTQSAKLKYDGSLESYIKIYLAFQEHVSNGRTPERNALFDLEFFLHLDAHNVKYTFVTTEKLWIELGKSAIPGRVIPLQSIL